MPRTLIRTLALAGAAVAGRIVPAAAQCPDGTPPPCGRAPAALPAPSRRPNPPLDERAWIVVPFENVTKAADIDWLRDASVNLLYLDMSKWKDIRVIDDERVADLIRDVPEARGGAQMTLESGLAVARRAGAGRLVMGDVLKLGARTQLVGKVFDVKSGQRMRTVRQDAAAADSILPAFGQLARAVLNVAPPSGTALGSIGTTSVGAYQSYLAGVGYLNRWILDSARTAFETSIGLDSAFALAHYKLALVYGWQSPGNQTGKLHAEQAQRLGTALPPRERTLVRGYAAFSGGRYADACEAFGSLIRTDSTDVEAWYNLGECTYHDSAVIPVPGDTARKMFRGSWNLSLRSFRKTLELDPTYHLAFQHIQDALLATTRAGCLTGPSGLCLDDVLGYQAILRRAGDSLLLEPVNQRLSGDAYAMQGLAARREHARRLNLEEARRAAEEWLALGPAEARPRLAYARILLRLGEPRRADSLFRLVVDLHSSRVEAATVMVDRIEAMLKTGRAEEASHLSDSLVAVTSRSAAARSLGAIFLAVFGRLGDLGHVADSAVQGPPFVREYFRRQGVALAGLAPDSLFVSESTFVRRVEGTAGATRVAANIAGSLLWIDPRIRGNRWPVFDTLNADPRLALISRLATKDTVRFRAELVRFDSIATALAEEPDNGFAMTGALAHLAVGDTAGALVRLRFFRDQTWRHSSILDQLAPGFTFAGMLWARTFLLLGDLAAATGSRAEAVEAYRQVVGMWAGADGELQPGVRRAREALTRPGN